MHVYQTMNLKDVVSMLATIDDRVSKLEADENSKIAIKVFLATCMAAIQENQQKLQDISRI